MKRLFLLAGLILLMSACEVHSYPDGSAVYSFPEPEIAIVVEAPPPPQPEVIVVEAPPQPVVVVQETYYPYYEDYCIDSAYDSCCYYYEYYDLYTHWQVCEITECYNPYWGYYQYEGQDCWYE